MKPRLNRHAERPLLTGSGYHHWVLSFSVAFFLSTLGQPL